MKKYYFDREICAECGGRCCKSIPAPCIPNDIQRLYPSDTLDNSVLLALKSGRFSIDWYEGSNRGKPYVRPSVKGSEGNMYDPSWGGECTFLKEKGCELSESKRPYYCKIVKPSAGGGCTTGVNGNQKLAAAATWKKVDLWQWRESYDNL